jgi:hypothetical protein
MRSDAVSHFEAPADVNFSDRLRIDSPFSSMRKPHSHRRSKRPFLTGTFHHHQPVVIPQPPSDLLLFICSLTVESRHIKKGMQHVGISYGVFRKSH